MKSITSIIFLLFLSINGLAQIDKFEKPNYKKIEKAIKLENSNLFYKTLFNRFTKADSTMTLDERRHLYFGYVFNKKYVPYGHSSYSDSLRNLINNKKTEIIDFDLMLRFSDSILQEYPFDLRTMNIKLYALDKAYKRKEFDRCLNKVEIILDAIFSSGDGIKKKTALYVISPSHEYDILDVLGFQYGGQQSLIEHFDYLKLAENAQGIEGLYFEISPCLNSLDKMFK
jgi:hypothetical protein